MVEDIYAVVKKGRMSRKGRGFSSYELKDAGLSIQQALDLGIPIDPKRSTRYDENVTALKGYHAVDTTPLASAVDLREVKGIGQKRAERLNAAGFDSVQKLAEGEPQHVAKAVGVSENRAANWIENAKLLLSS